MLLGLTIRDLVLIDRLSLAFRPGLCVLTGETGAGKSILLDALGLALGKRAEAGLVRAGAAQASVTAEFSVGPNHPAASILSGAGILNDSGIPAGEGAESPIVLRRVVGADGRSRAFINDEPASVALLRELGDTLVEIQGQFEQRGLLDPATHRMLLDALAEHSVPPERLARSWRVWREARDAEAAAERRRKEAAAEEDLLRHDLAELDALAPQADEEQRLADRRILLQQSERLAETLRDATVEIEGEKGALPALARASRKLERARGRAQGLLDAASAALERAATETDEALRALEEASRGLDLDPRALENVEERLFALRALARKHDLPVSQLPTLQAEIGQKLEAIEHQAGDAAALARRTREARVAFAGNAAAVSRARALAAGRLDTALQEELKPLRLEKARFRTVLTPLPDADWSEHGAERVHFEVATNPGSPFGPLSRIASGGELSRFMLALKLVLSGTASVPTLVFDEVDSGIGGAVAAAVGDRLQRLGASAQLLVVTHSPQVAARGATHWRVAKHQAARDTVTRVEELDPEMRQEEIARMLSGSTITQEARAAAASLIAGDAA